MFHMRYMEGYNSRCFKTLPDFFFCSIFVSHTTKNLLQLVALEICKKKKIVKLMVLNQKIAI
jgi:hypothetical protein